MNIAEITNKLYEKVKNVSHKAVNTSLDYVSMIPKKLLYMTLAGVILLNVAAANAEPIVDIAENDGVPVVQTDPTQLLWDYNVKNNSDTEPVGHPLEEDIFAVELYNLFSTSTPSYSILPSGWSGAATEQPNNLWDVTLTNSSGGITDGNNVDFQIITYRSSFLPDVVIGTLYGKGDFEGSGLLPLGDGDSFQGPIGEDYTGVLDSQGWNLTNIGNQFVDYALPAIDEGVTRGVPITYFINASDVNDVDGNPVSDPNNMYFKLMSIECKFPVLEDVRNADHGTMKYTDVDESGNSMTPRFEGAAYPVDDSEDPNTGFYPGDNVYLFAVNTNDPNIYFAQVSGDPLLYKPEEGVKQELSPITLQPLTDNQLGRALMNKQAVMDGLDNQDNPDAYWTVNFLHFAPLANHWYDETENETTMENLITTSGQWLEKVDPNNLNE